MGSGKGGFSERVIFSKSKKLANMNFGTKESSMFIHLNLLFLETTPHPETLALALPLHLHEKYNI